MRRRALPYLVPLGLAAFALLHGSPAGTFASSGGVGLTNVSGQPGDCSTPTRNAACATLFDGAGLLYPGGPEIERSATVTWHGSQAPTAFGLYIGNFISHHPKSQPACTAPDPADKLDLRISQDGAVLYQGTLSDFAGAHHAAPDILPVHGDSGRFTFAVALDPSADNAYMGCVSMADLVWVAS